MKQIILNLEDEQVESIANFIFKQNECPTIKQLKKYNQTCDTCLYYKPMQLHHYECTEGFFEHRSPNCHNHSKWTPKPKDCKY